MEERSASPVHPLRATVFVPRVLAYGLVGALLVREASAGPGGLALGCWMLSAPWLLRRPVAAAVHGVLRALEALLLPLLGLLAGVPLLVLAAGLLPFLLGVLSVHGPRAGGLCLLLWALVLVPGALLLDPPPFGTQAGLLAAAALVLAFALVVAALTHVQAGRLDAARAELAARAAREAALAERLARYLPPAVHRVAFEAEGAGNRSRRRWLTVCFADLAGFTALTDAAESEEVVAMLDDFYGAMAAAARTHGGTLDKFIGDAVMVFFGDDDGGDRHGDARAALAMALDMQRRFDALRLRWREAGVLRPLDLRVGVHSGWCTVGVFGPSERRAYTVIGASVNTASRLEAAAAPGEILLSRATWLLLGDAGARCRRVGPLRARGLRDPVETFRVLRDDPDAPLELAVDGLSLRLAPDAVDPLEARAALERALGALPADLAAPGSGAG